MEFPLVSVLITVYDGMPTIGKCIEALLAQTYEHLEVVIVDDGSTDGTRELISQMAERDPRIKLVYQGRVGRGRALNLGLQHCSGEFIAVNDADDLSLSGRIERQVEFLLNRPEYVLVGGRMELSNLDTGEVRPDTFLHRPIENEEIRRYFLRGQPIQHSTVLMRQEAVRQIGGYNEGIKFLYDRDLFVRLMSIGKLHNLDEVLIRLGRHGKQFFYHTYVGRDRIRQDFRYRFMAARILGTPMRTRFKLWLMLQWKLMPNGIRNMIKPLFTSNLRKINP